ncbi:MAG: hypothetical protein R2764_10910 [Bacteroidales bacterium]
MVQTNDPLIARFKSVLLPDLSPWNIFTENPLVEVLGYLEDNSIFANDDGIVYVLENVIASNLTITEGSIIKFEPSISSELIIRDGVLDVQGTSTNPVIFTSIHDDRWGGDSNGNGNATEPDQGKWAGINIDGTGSNTPGNASCDMDYAHIYYAGANNNDAIELRGCNTMPKLENVRVEMSKRHGLYSIDCKPQIKSCSFINNKRHAIHTMDDALIIPPLFFRNNDTYFEGIDIFNGGTDNYVATHCDWGTIDSTEIAERVWEQHDDPSVGEVTSWPIYQNDKMDYHNISKDDIMNQFLEPYTLTENLDEGSIFVYISGENNHGKFIIQQKTNDSYYFWWETFEGDSTKSVGHNLIVPFGSYVDMDLGIISDPVNNLISGYTIMVTYMKKQYPQFEPV